MHCPRQDQADWGHCTFAEVPHYSNDRPNSRDVCGADSGAGAGNGALTLRLAARCPEAQILACEINPVLARKTRDNLDRAGINGRVKVISDSAEHLLSEMRRRGMEKVDYVLSGIPLGNLPGEQTQALIDAISETLRPGGLYIQFQYSLIDRKRIRSRFTLLRTVPVLLNIPPAVVYYAQR